MIDQVVPCEDLVLVRPTSNEVDMLTEMTARMILANNRVIEGGCR